MRGLFIDDMIKSLILAYLPFINAYIILKHSSAVHKFCYGEELYNRVIALVLVNISRVLISK